MSIRFRLPLFAEVALVSTATLMGQVAAGQGVGQFTFSGIVIAEDRAPLSDAVLGFEHREDAQSRPQDQHASKGGR